MTDLDAAIRAKLAQLVPPALKWRPVMGLDGPARPEDFEASWSPAPTLGAQSPSPVHQMHDALLAVLDLHAAPERALPGELHCGELIDWVQGGCPTVRAIAKALGVEVTDD